MMYQWIVEQGYHPIIIATKLDKIKRSQIQKHVKMLKQGLDLVPGTKVLPFSSVSKQGKEDIWELIEAECLMWRRRMENKRPYWQVGIRLLFSLAATAAFVIIGIKAIGFLMPFVIGWIISAVAAPLVNWLEKRLRIVKKLGSALIVILVLGGIVGILYLGISRLILEVASLVRDFSVDICTTGKRVESDRRYSFGSIR